MHQNSNNTRDKVGNCAGAVGPSQPLQKRGWRGLGAWNDSELLKSGSHVGSEVEEGAGEGIRQQDCHSSDGVAREMVEEHLQWSGWWR